MYSLNRATRVVKIFDSAFVHVTNALAGPAEICDIASVWIAVYTNIRESTVLQ